MQFSHRIRRSYKAFMRFFKLRSYKPYQSVLLAIAFVSIIALSFYHTYASILTSSKRHSKGLSYYEQMLLNNEQDSSIGVKLEADSLLSRLQSGLNFKMLQRSSKEDTIDNDQTTSSNKLNRDLLPEIENYELKLKQLIDGTHYGNEINNRGAHNKNNQAPSFVTLPKSEKDLKREKKLQVYFKNLIQIVKLNKPRAGFELAKGSKNIGSDEDFIFEREYGSSGVINVAAHDHGPDFPILSEDYLSKGLKIPIELSKELKKSHMFVVQELPSEYPEDLYSGEGIVMVAGGKFSWLALLSIENLRQVGSKLPIEVIVPTEKEYEKELCEKVFPTLNAKCLLLSDMLPEIKNSKLNIGGYQFKSMALLASSFEKVLLLDSDNLAVSNPDLLFDSEPFNSSGMVLWPDFWRRVTHPDYYTIINKHIGGKRIRNLNDDVTPPQYYSSGTEDPIHGLPLHDREGTLPDVSTESGQLLVNKKTHIKSLQLAFYYNFYGPRHYYPLIAQGSSGEGDKDTFYAAAHYFNHSVYQVKKAVDSIGYWNDGNTKYVGVGMIQYDPVSDYNNLKQYLTWFYKRSTETKKDNSGVFNRLKAWLEGGVKIYDEAHTFPHYFTKEKSKPLFVHANFPKLDPVTLRKEKRLFDPETKKRVRLYRDQPRSLGFDFELRQWNLFNKYFCDKGITLSYLKIVGVSSRDYCDFIHREISFLESTSDEVLHLS